MNYKHRILHVPQLQPRVWRAACAQTLPSPHAALSLLCLPPPDHGCCPGATFASRTLPPTCGQLLWDAVTQQACANSRLHRGVRDAQGPAAPALGSTKKRGPHPMADQPAVCLALPCICESTTRHQPSSPPLHILGRKLNLP